MNLTPACINANFFVRDNLLIAISRFDAPICLHNLPRIPVSQGRAPRVFGCRACIVRGEAFV